MLEIPSIPGEPSTVHCQRTSSAEHLGSTLLPPAQIFIRHVCCLFEARVWDAVVGWKRTGGKSSSQAGSSGPAVKRANTRICYIKRLFEWGGKRGQCLGTTLVRPNQQTFCGRIALLGLLLPFGVYPVAELASAQPISDAPKHWPET